MLPTEELRKLDEFHSFIAELVGQGENSVVFSTLASVLSQNPILDKPSNDPHYWQQVIFNLNTLADECQRAELSDDAMYGEPSEEDWRHADQLLDDEDQMYD